jgi:hypothetical protein
VTSHVEPLEADAAGNRAARDDNILPVLFSPQVLDGLVRQERRGKVSSASARVPKAAIPGCARDRRRAGTQRLPTGASAPVLIHSAASLGTSCHPDGSVLVPRPALRRHDGRGLRRHAGRRWLGRQEGRGLRHGSGLRGGQGRTRIWHRLGDGARRRAAGLPGCQVRLLLLVVYRVGRDQTLQCAVFVKGVVRCRIRPRL